MNRTGTGDITPAEFVAKWSRTELSERAASQEHFIDLCRLLGQPTPAEHDATGAEYTFEKGVSVTGSASRGSAGSHGFADVWWRNKFAWEYKRKGKYKSLAEAYGQLLQYREALDNPPLLIVSDIARTEIHTNFTGTAKQTYVVELDRLADADQLDLLRRVFTDPWSFKPSLTPEGITEGVAADFAKLATSLADRGHDPHDAAHFLMKCMFCLFAEDVHLLPDHIFEKMLKQWRDAPDELTDRLTELFTRMSDGGAFGFERIPHFNGGLFDKSPALPLTESEVGVLILAARQDWSQVEPAIFGTLFERSLDPNKRAQIGAHYTSREDILLIVEPVVMAPLRRRWEEVKQEVDALLARRRAAKTTRTRRTVDNKINAEIQDFLHHVAHVKILDPACGSGNFLYVAIQQLLGLEKEVITYAARPDIGLGLIPHVRPTQLHGIEVNAYAAELAQVVIWIGYLQWMHANGFNAPRNPILDPLTTIEHRDAILAWEDEAGQPIPIYREGATCRGPADWPEADFIIGNPPFLGSKLFRASGLPDPYIDAMYESYDLPNTSDLCCYWFERARQVIATSRDRKGAVPPRAGLLATQGIRGGANRKVLERIKKAGNIFMAWADRPWILDGAAVHVSMVGFDGGDEKHVALEGIPVEEIHANLRGDVNTASASRLSENAAVRWSIGTQKGGSFEFDVSQARKLLTYPNPTGRSNADVVRPWRNASDVTRRPRGLWIVDFGPDTPESQACRYETPFEYVREHVKPERDGNRRDSYRLKWWIHQEARADLRPVLETPVVLLTPRIAKHRLWVRARSAILPDCALVVIARSDDYFFGVLHSSVHELWALRMGTQLEDRPRYTPTTCFETFPLPWAPGQEPGEGEAGRELWERIGEAAKELDELRERWLNPPEWIEPIAKWVDMRDKFDDVPAEARPLIRQSAIMAAAAKDKRLKKRTLTNLYNERPTWLKLAHEKLDRAVLAAYAHTDPAGNWSEDWAEAWRDTGAGQPLPEDHEHAPLRTEVDQTVLANLLRLNQERSGSTTGESHD